ncbi:hypothetical protein [Paenibacillus campi]|uniref:hypothetical protein n=1 Tax=Paenibacillus campi TaxID=3106031 RepID=UPI002AFEDD24|nr:hypothetical protein [Paenibacillus sp. SGZ-1014]
MMIPVHLQWEIDPARLPYRQWFGTTGLAARLTAETAICADDKGSLFGNTHAMDSADDNYRLAESFTDTSTIEHDVQLYITSRSVHSWDTLGKLRLQAGELIAMDSLEPGSQFWLWEGDVLAVVTVLDCTIAVSELSMSLQSSVSREDVATRHIVHHSFDSSTSRPVF